MYIPKNKIKTNLYTKGEEYKNVVTGAPYTGYYWTMYTGKFFTGKNPNDAPTEEIVPITAVIDSVWDLTSQQKQFQQYAANWDGETAPGKYQSMEDIDTYNNIRRIDISVTKQVPQQYYPTPTDEEYELGVFMRYFVVKTNENIYIELDKTTYNKMVDQDIQYLYELYIPFKIQWTLVGEEAEVSAANRNILELKEASLNKSGLTEFLNKPTTFSLDYLQFYAPDSGKILYTGDPSKEGEEGLVLPDGTAYIGFYHVMLDGTIMTGKSHKTGNNIILTSIYD